MLTSGSKTRSDPEPTTNLPNILTPATQYLITELCQGRSLILTRLRYHSLTKVYKELSVTDARLLKGEAGEFTVTQG